MQILTGSNLDNLVQLHKTGKIREQKKLTVSDANNHILAYFIQLLTGSGNNGFKRIVSTASTDTLEYLYKIAEAESEFILTHAFRSVLQTSVAA